MVRLFPSPGMQAFREAREAHLRKHREWWVLYDLIYEGGGTAVWWGYYRTPWTAWLASWWNMYIKSYGGTADRYPRSEAIAKDIQMQREREARERKYEKRRRRRGK